MRSVNPGEVWMTDFGMAAKGVLTAEEMDRVRSALKNRLGI
jgi:hypothetical protein